jgi:hypothetical protein
MSISSFYKYCPVYQDNCFDSEYSVVNLLADQVTFSTRKNFNDLFDSKINLIKPSKKQLKKLGNELKTSKRLELRSVFCGDDWDLRVEELHQKINKMLDDYLYFCVTDKSDNNLMWSHYANSHKGFCIEWDANKIQAEKVLYQPTIPQVDLIELIKVERGVVNKQEVGEALWLALRTKLNEWKYESEYRFQLGNTMRGNIVKSEENFSLVKYKPEYIKSIIWGCRTTEKTKLYIKEHLHFEVKFKQAKEDLSSIFIVDENDISH